LQDIEARRRLPAPRRIIEHSESFEIQDAAGRKIASIYFKDSQATIADFLE
jgi:hypothetical protein